MVRVCYGVQSPAGPSGPTRFASAMTDNRQLFHDSPWRMLYKCAFEGHLHADKHRRAHDLTIYEYSDSLKDRLKVQQGETPHVI